MSNIEKDIKRCEELIKPEHANWIGISNQLAIAHIVDRIKELEAKQKEMCEEYCPKTERIKELEQENKIQRRQLNSAFDRGWIPKEKVKDKIEEYFEDEEWLIEHDLKALCDDEKECREYYINKKNCIKRYKKEYFR